MSKQLRAVLIAVFVFAALIVLYLCLKPSETGEDVTSDVSSEAASNTSSVADEEKLTLYSYDTALFSSAEITDFSGNTYHVVRSGDSYDIPELADLPHYVSGIQICAERLCAYPYTQQTEESDEVTGLDAPKGKVTVTFTDNTSLTLLIGNRTDNGLYYMRREGDDVTVLTATGISSYFVRGTVNYLKTSLFYCVEERRTGIDNISFTDTEAPYPVCIKKTDGDSASALAISSTYYLTFPTTMSVDSEAFDTGLTELAAFAAEGAMEIVSEKTDLSQYGLDNPRYVLSFTYQKPLDDDDTSEENTNPVETHRFAISDADEGGFHYLLSEDGKIVYYFSEDMYSFMSWKLENMAGSTFLSPMIKTLDRMRVLYGGREYSFEFTEGDGSISVVRYEDRQLDVDNFKKFYQVVLGTGWIDLGVKETGAEPYLSVIFDYHDDLKKADDTMVFYPYSLRQYAVEINGQGAFTVPKTRLDKVVSDLFKVIKNEKVTAFLN